MEKFSVMLVKTDNYPHWMGSSQGTSVAVVSSEFSATSQQKLWWAEWALSQDYNVLKTMTNVPESSNISMKNV